MDADLFVSQKSVILPARPFAQLVLFRFFNGLATFAALALATVLGCSSAANANAANPETKSRRSTS
jgi:hypothetical protein